MRASSKNNPLKYIRRFNKVDGWGVTIRRYGKTLFKFFGDPVHGSKENSLKAAVKHRDECIKKLDDAIDEYTKWRCSKKRSTNVSGIVGVLRVSGARGCSDSWRAVWTDIDGKKRTRSFSIQLYGEAKAKRLARDARKVAIDNLADVLKNRDDVWIKNTQKLARATEKMEQSALSVLINLLDRIKSTTKDTLPISLNKRDLLHHIQRVNSDNRKHYCWKVYMNRCGELIHKYFTDSIYGGEEIALCAALVYRDEYFRNFAINEYAVWRRNVNSSRNTSGIVGIGRYLSIKKNGLHCPMWQAFWNDADGKRVSRSFSINVHGERKAKLLAYKTREEGIKEVERVFAQRRDMILKKKVKFAAEPFFSVERAAISIKDMLYLLCMAKERGYVSIELLMEIKEVTQNK